MLLGGLGISQLGLVESAAVWVHHLTIHTARYAPSDVQRLVGQRWILGRQAIAAVGECFKPKLTLAACLESVGAAVLGIGLADEFI